MRLHRVLAVTVVVSHVTVLLGVPSATASCAGPQLSVEAGPTSGPVVVGAGTLTVAGTWFHEGCDDTGRGAGCAGPITTSQSPMRDVELLLEQGGTTWSLGEADAAGHRGNYAISWEAQVPADVQDGPATLSASTARLDVQIVRSATQGADGGDPYREGTERGQPDR